MLIFALLNNSTWDQAASFFSVSRSHTIRHTHTHTHTHTAGMTPLNEWSARHRRRYLNNTQQTQETNIHALSGIWTQIPALQRRQTYALGHKDTGIGLKYYTVCVIGSAMKVNHHEWMSERMDDMISSLRAPFYAFRAKDAHSHSLLGAGQGIRAFGLVGLN
jgi:hypothetical protein